MFWTAAIDHKVVKLLEKGLLLLAGFCSNILTLFHTIWLLETLKKQSFKALREKGKIMVTTMFSIKRKNYNFSNIKFVVYKCFQSGPVQNVVV